MADVFISYSRRDKAFATRLHTVLAENKRDIWIDWEDIPLTADWWQEISNGIEAADNFIFIISPESLSSPVCMLEIDYANMHHKRLVPVVLHPPDEKAAYEALATREIDGNTRRALKDRDIVDIAKENWQAIARHNWLFFDDDNLFNERFQKLLEAIDTDLDHARIHTRLLVRAREWESSDHNTSYVLRGADLSRAEVWLREVGTKKPQPTPLHTEYIVASRQHAIRNQRSFTLMLTGGIVVAVILAVIAVLFAIDAWNQRNRAEETLRIAWDIQALFQADLSNQQLRFGDPYNALLLALESLNHYPEIYRPQSAVALSNALISPVQERMTLQHSSGVYGAEWNADESKILTGTDDNLYYIWDAASGLLLHTLTNEIGLMSANWSHDGKFIVTGSGDGQAQVWDADSGQITLSLAHEATVYNAIWNADDTRILTITDDQKIHLWDATNRTELFSAAHNDYIANAVFSPDQSLILTWSADGSARIWDANTGQEVYAMFHRGEVLGAAWNQDGTKILTWSADGSARLWDAVNHEQVLEMSHDLWAVTGAAWNADESLILSWAIDGRILVWEPPDPEPVISLPRADAVNGAIFTADDTTLISWTKEGNIYFWDMEDSEDDYSIILNSSILGVTLNADETRLLAWEENGTVTVIDLASDEDIINLRHGQSVKGAAWNKSETEILSWSDDGRVRVWNTQGSPALPTLSYLVGYPINGAQWSKNNQQILGWGIFGAQLWDVTSGEMRENFGNDIVHAVINADASKMFTLSLNDRIEIWDTASNVRLRTIFLTGPALEIALSPDETQILTLSNSAVTVWDIATGNLVRTIPENAQMYLSEWNPQHTLVLSLVDREQDVLAVWDIATGEQIASLEHPGLLNSNWSANGQHLISWSGSDVKVWDALSGAEIATIPVDAPINFADINQDGTQVLITLSGRGIERSTIYDVATKNAVISISTPRTSSGIVWSPDGSAILFRYPDSQLSVWDVNPQSAAVGTEQLRLRPEFNVTGLVWNEAGTHLLTWADDGTIQVWFSDIDDYLALGQASRVREFDNQDRERFFLPTETPAMERSS